MQDICPSARWILDGGAVAVVISKAPLVGICHMMYDWKIYVLTELSLLGESLLYLYQYTLGNAVQSSLRAIYANMLPAKPVYLTIIVQVLSFQIVSSSSKAVMGKKQ